MLLAEAEAPNQDGEMVEHDAFQAAHWVDDRVCVEWIGIERTERRRRFAKM